MGMKKRMKKSGMAAFAVTMAVMLTACGGNSGVKPDASDLANQSDLQDAIDGVMGQAEEAAANAADADSLSYVTPEESDFTWEEADGGVSITGYTGENTAILLPETLGGEAVVGIGSGAFSGAALEGVQLPDSIIRIGDEAFSFCSSLVTVTFGESVKEIGAEAFMWCSALSDVALDVALETIGDSAFAACTSLQRITLPEGLQIIEAGAFCLSGLVEITIPASVEEIGEQVFDACASLEKVTIQSGLAAIGEDAICNDFNEELIICAPAGSTAETYAAENGINFEEL